MTSRESNFMEELMKEAIQQLYNIKTDTEELKTTKNKEKKPEDRKEQELTREEINELFKDIIVEDLVNVEEDEEFMKELFFNREKVREEMKEEKDNSININVNLNIKFIK